MYESVISIRGKRRRALLSKTTVFARYINSFRNSRKRKYLLSKVQNKEQRYLNNANGIILCVMILIKLLKTCHPPTYTLKKIIIIPLCTDIEYQTKTMKM